MSELSIIQKTYELVKWFVPFLNKLPRNQKFLLADRIIKELYDLLEQLILAQYAKQKIDLLEPLNARLQILRFQTRLLLDFNLIPERRYQYANQQINEIGRELGGWIKTQRHREYIN